MDMLQITDLHKRFGEKQVLKGLTLSVPEHSIYGFIGQNGAGKTTTMKIILGLLQADAGEIMIAGEKVTYGQTATNRHIGYLPDVPEFYPFMTAAEYLTFCGEICGMKKSEIKSRSQELLTLVGLHDETHRIKGFSRGMKQRLGIAQALLNKPKLLICDEPTSALDPVGRKEILDILLAVKEQTTVLFSTHILSDVERICTDVAFLKDGMITMKGPLSRIRSQYRREEYLLETENEADLHRLLGCIAAFRQTTPTDATSPTNNISATGNIPATGDSFATQTNQLTFCETDIALFHVLRLLSDHQIPIRKLQRLEPTLESLFMEVATK